MIRALLAFGTLAAFAAPATAQETSPAPGTIALTPEEREAALEAGAARAADESLRNGASDRRVHGEVGVEVGSRGERAAYGTLVAPVGQNGVAAISYGTGQGPRWHGRHGRGGGRYGGSSFGAAYSSDSGATPVPSAADAENVNPD
jgi:cytosine/adenosine deaminase-related metal-dependent hydrolase